MSQKSCNKFNQVALGEHPHLHTLDNYGKDCKGKHTTMNQMDEKIVTKMNTFLYI